MKPRERRRIGRIADRVEGIGPDAARSLSGVALGGQQFGRTGPIVAERVDPRQTEPQHFMLQPDLPAIGIGDKEMGEDAAMPVRAAAAMAQRDACAARQIGEGGARNLGQRPGFETGASERQLRRLDAGEANLPAIVEHKRVAIDDLDRARLCTRLQFASRLCRRQDEQQGTEKRGGEPEAAADGENLHQKPPFPRSLGPGYLGAKRRAGKGRPPDDCSAAGADVGCATRGLRLPVPLPASSRCGPVAQLDRASDS